MKTIILVYKSSFGRFACEIQHPDGTVEPGPMGQEIAEVATTLSKHPVLENLKGFGGRAEIIFQHRVTISYSPGIGGHTIVEAREGIELNDGRKFWVAFEKQFKKS